MPQSEASWLYLIGYVSLLGALFWWAVICGQEAYDHERQYQAKKTKEELRRMR